MPPVPTRSGGNLIEKVVPKLKDVEMTLRAEVDRLEQMLGLPLYLTVRWVPTAKSPLAGEVKDDCILLYTNDEVEAHTVLRHEVIDYCISRAIMPYQKLTNHLIALLNDQAYRIRKAIVEALTHLVPRES